MGIVRVACWAARTAGVGAATITSTLSRTISAARPEAAQRHEVAPLDRWFLLNALSESGVVRALEQPGRVHAGALLTGWAECSRVRQRRPKQTIQKVRGLVTGLALAEITGLPLGLRMILSVSTWQVNPNMMGRNSVRAPEPSSVSTSPSAQSSEPQAPTILVVDDDPTIGPWVRGALEPLGYVVLTTVDPSEAIRMGKDRPGDIELLLVDVVMPLMDGRKLAQRLRTLRPRLKVVFMSGYGLSELEEMGAPFMVKPFGMDELAQMVAATLRNETPASPPRQGRI